jgi:hypothetical protein
MIDLVALATVLAVSAAISVGFAIACWRGYQRGHRWGVVTIWLVATLIGTALLASGVAAPRRVQNVGQLIAALLVSAVVFGAGALVVFQSLHHESAKGSHGSHERDTRHLSVGLVIRASGAMLLALLLGLLTLAMSSRWL